MILSIRVPQLGASERKNIVEGAAAPQYCRRQYKTSPYTAKIYLNRSKA